MGVIGIIDFIEFIVENTASSVLRPIVDQKKINWHLSSQETPKNTKNPLLLGDIERSHHRFKN